MGAGDLHVRVEPREGFLDAIDRASKLREILLAEVKALIARDVADRRPLDSLKGGKGYSSIGTDLSTLAGVLRAHPEEVAPKTMKLVEEAQTLSQQIIWEAPKRGSESSTVDAASDDRHRSHAGARSGPAFDLMMLAPRASSMPRRRCGRRQNARKLLGDGRRKHC